MARKSKQHPGIRQRGGRWQVRVCVNGEHLAKSFATHTEALEFYLEHKDQATGGSVAKRKEAEKLTFAAFLERYYNEYGALKRGRRQEQNRVKRLSQEPFAAKKLLEVDTHDFAEFIRRRREGGASDPTIRLDIYLINHAYNRARTEWGYKFLRNPLNDLERKPAMSKGRFRVFQGNEEERLAAALAECRTPYLEPFILFGIDTTIRPREVLDLTWADLHELEREAHIRMGKDGEPRFAPLSLLAIEILRGIPREPEFANVVFPTTINAIQCAWKKALKRAGITDLRLTDLRHVGATFWSKVFRGDIFLLQKVTGHKQVKTLEKYVNYTKGDVQAAMDGQAPSPTPANPLATLGFQPSPAGRLYALRGTRVVSEEPRVVSKEPSNVIPFPRDAACKTAPPGSTGSQ